MPDARTSASDQVRELVVVKRLGGPDPPGADLREVEQDAQARFVVGLHSRVDTAFVIVNLAIVKVFLLNAGAGQNGVLTVASSSA
ncbi:hypothetical protein [Streptomyces sp. NPDC001480]|uniref:hypothetical protein n=1 Tax=Streptomyces sp. NPDC001480 TaxID=3364577 RepID=UPI003691F90E